MGTLSFRHSQQSVAEQAVDLMSQLPGLVAQQVGMAPSQVERELAILSGRETMERLVTAATQAVALAAQMRRVLPEPAASVEMAESE